MLRLKFDLKHFWKLKNKIMGCQKDGINTTTKLA
jgi:hypothetical protein